MADTKEEKVQINITRNENKVILSFLDNKEEEEFSTEEDAAKAEHLAMTFISLIQWLVSNGATFLSSETVENDQEA